jgi:hypothetical protein
LPLEGVTAGGDSGGPLVIKVNGHDYVAGIAHGLDPSVADVTHMRGQFPVRLMRAAVCCGKGWVLCAVD